MDGENGSNPLDRIEQSIAAHDKQIAQLTETSQRLVANNEAHDRQIQTLRSVAQDTNERIDALVSSIGDYIPTREREIDQ